MTVRSPDAPLQRNSFLELISRLSSAQKKRARGAPAYSIYVNRPLGRPLAAAAYVAGLTPNAVSAISAAFTFSGIFLMAIATPTLWLGPLITGLLVLGYALDSADGQLARLRGGGTAAGEWLDHVIDSAKTSSIHLAVLITAFLHFNLPSMGWLLVPIGFAVVAAVSFLAIILNDQLRARYVAESSGSPRADSTPIRSLLGLPTDYGILCLTFLVLGWPAIFFTIYTVLLAANLGYLLLASLKWFGEMARLSEEEGNDR